MAWHPFRNLGLKVVALLLGALLWFTVSGQQAERNVTGVPVVYRNKPQGLEITEQTKTVDIHVRGLDNQLRAALGRDFEARVDLTGARAGSQAFVLRTDQVSAPFGLEVTQVDPGTATALLEEAGTANLPVQPYVDGTPAPGFVVSGITTDPAAVTVTGPRRRIIGTLAATTDRVSIDGARDTVTQTVSVGVPDAALRLRESATAKVTVTIEPAGERLYAAVRVSIRNLASGARCVVEPAVVSMLLRGPQTILGRLEPRAIGPYVDVAGLGPGRHEVPVLFDLAGRLTVASVRPAAVTVIIN
jgi:YbbR domain-containing protein